MRRVVESVGRAVVYDAISEGLRPDHKHRVVLHHEHLSRREGDGLHMLEVAIIVDGSQVKWSRVRAAVGGGKSLAVGGCKQVFAHGLNTDGERTGISFETRIGVYAFDEFPVVGSAFPEGFERERPDIVYIERAANGEDIEWVFELHRTAALTSESVDVVSVWTENEDFFLSGVEQEESSVGMPGEIGNLLEKDIIRIGGTLTERQDGCESLVGLVRDRIGSNGVG